MEIFFSKLLDLGFVLTLSCSSLFVRVNGCTRTYLLLYVDDIILTCNNFTFIVNLIQQLGQHCKMKDMGLLSYFLGIEVHRNYQGLLLSQAKHITDLLVKSDMLGCKPVGSPASMEKLSPSDGVPMDDPIQFRLIVGAFNMSHLHRYLLRYQSGMPIYACSYICSFHSC